MQRKAGSCARREPFTKVLAEPKAILGYFDVDWRCHYAASVQIKGRLWEKVREIRPDLPL